MILLTIASSLWVIVVYVAVYRAHTRLDALESHIEWLHKRIRALEFASQKQFFERRLQEAWQKERR